MQEVPDVQPGFVSVKNLFRQVNPLHTITIGVKSEAFVECVSALVDNISQTPSHVNQTKTLPSGFTLLKKDNCKFTIFMYEYDNYASLLNYSKLV